MVRRSFRCEKKSFVVNFSKDVFEVSEKSRSLEVSVGLETSLARWLIGKLQLLVEKGWRLGFLVVKRASPGM